MGVRSAPPLQNYGTTSLRHGYRRGPVRRARVISQKKSTRRARYSTGLLHRRAPIVGGRSGPQGFTTTEILPARDKNQSCNICGSGCNSRRRSSEWSGERGLSTKNLSAAHHAPRGAWRPPKNPAALNIRPFFFASPCTGSLPFGTEKCCEPSLRTRKAGKRKARQSRSIRAAARTTPAPRPLPPLAPWRPAHPV